MGYGTLSGLELEDMLDIYDLIVFIIFKIMILESMLHRLQCLLNSDGFIPVKGRRTQWQSAIYVSITV